MPTVCALLLFTLEGEVPSCSQTSTCILELTNIFGLDAHFWRNISYMLTFEGSFCTCVSDLTKVLSWKFINRYISINKIWRSRKFEIKSVFLIRGGGKSRIKKLYRVWFFPRSSLPWIV